MNEIETITGRLVIRDSPDPSFTNLGMLKRLKSVNMGNTRQKRGIILIMNGLVFLGV